MQTKTMQGVYPILAMPFDEAAKIDEECLRRLIRFNLAAGVHGLGVALASEIFKLNEAERELVIRIVVDEVAGRVPVVINTSAAGTDLAVFYSQMAEQLGADALMVMPPTFMAVSAAETVGYFQAISNAVKLPIFIQDVANAPVSAGLARQIAEACQWVRYMKVETVPVVAKVAEMVTKVGDRLVVFGGAGGGYFIEELRRGAVGTMPFSTQPEAFVEIWNLYQQGDEAGAAEIFNRKLLPIMRLAGQGAGLFFQLHKEILCHRGVFRTANVRGPSAAMDNLTRQELQEALDRLYPQ